MSMASAEMTVTAVTAAVLTADSAENADGKSGRSGKNAETISVRKKMEKFLSAAPGLTGYWQAYARSDCSYEQRMEMELHYVDNANFWWDMKIIIVTFFAVIRGKGAR